jgi:hypothetical protein
MSDQEWVESNRQAAARVPRLDALFAACVLLGLAGLGLFARDGIRAWQAYWINFLFWMGLAQAGVALAAVVRLAKGTWGGAMIRLALLQVSFLPVAIVLFLGIALMSSRVLPWVADPVPGKEWWLNLPSFLLRDGIALAALCAISVAFAYWSVRPDAGRLAEGGSGSYFSWLARGWRGAAVEKERSERNLSWLSPLLVIAYGAVYTLIAFDMIMSLDPSWYSTLFGAYYFITAGYLGIAWVAILSALARRVMRMETEFTAGRFHDLGKLVFAFGLLSAYFFWSQWLVLWYGNLPDEIRFVLRRTQHQPWLTVIWVVIFGGFVVPWTILLSSRVKRIPVALAALALMIVVCGYCERVLMIVPSLHGPDSGYRFVFGVPEILITLGFAGLYGLSLLWSLRSMPLVPESVVPERG